MCILSRRINDVASTHIFVSDLGRGEHCTIYSMQINTPQDVAMILPVPVIPGSGEDALRFVDLSGYPDIFKAFEKLYPVSKSMSFGGPASGASRGILKVHDVGSFVASYVPTKTHFHRLHEQFRLDPSVWDTLPNYQGFGFAVFQLKPTLGPRPVHPMAYVYPADTPTELFYPTVHVHDGRTADAKAHFDHTLYYQESKNFPPCEQWQQSGGRVSEVVDLPRTMGLVTGRAMYRTTIHGNHPNADQVLAVEEDGTPVHKQRGLRAA